MPACKSSLQTAATTSSVDAPMHLASQQVVFCDFDGPIVDVSERYYQTYRRGLVVVELLCRQEGATSTLTPLCKEQFWAKKQNRVPDREIALCSGVPDEWFELFMNQVEKIVNHSSLLRWDCIQPSAREALVHFKRANMRTVLVTLRQPRQVAAFLQSQGLTHLVDDIYGASSVKAAYQNRVVHKCELLAEAIAQQTNQGYTTQNSWMVGDTEADVIAAKQMGLPSAALSCGVRSADYLKALEPTSLHDGLLSAAQTVVNNQQLQAA